MPEHCFCTQLGNSNCDHYVPPKIVSREEKVARLATQNRDEHGTPVTEDDPVAARYDATG